MEGNMFCNWGWPGHWFGVNPFIMIFLVTSGIFLLIIFLRNKTTQPTCQACGGAVKDAYLRCPHCGTTLKAHCPDCSTIIEAKWNYCPECHSDLGRKTNHKETTP